MAVAEAESVGARAEEAERRVKQVPLRDGAVVLLCTLALSCAILRYLAQSCYLLEGAWNPRPPRLSLALTRSAGRGLQLQMSLDELHQDVFVAQVSGFTNTLPLAAVPTTAVPPWPNHFSQGSERIGGAPWVPAHVS